MEWHSKSKRVLHGIYWNELIYFFCYNCLALATLLVRVYHWQPNQMEWNKTLDLIYSHNFSQSDVSFSSDLAKHQVIWFHSILGFQIDLLCHLFGVHRVSQKNPDRIFIFCSTHISSLAEQSEMMNSILLCSKSAWKCNCKILVETLEGELMVGQITENAVDSPKMKPNTWAAVTMTVSQSSSPSSLPSSSPSSSSLSSTIVSSDVIITTPSLSFWSTSKFWGKKCQNQFGQREPHQIWAMPKTVFIFWQGFFKVGLEERNSEFLL